MFRVTYQEEFQVMVDLTGLSHPGLSLVKGTVLPSPRAMVLTDSWTLSPPPQKMAPRSPHQARPQGRPQLDIQKAGRGFPGGAVVESLPANAGDTGSSPGLGGSHVPRSGWASEPQLLSLRVWSLCPAAGGAAMVRGPRTAMKSGPRTAMKSGPRTAMKSGPRLPQLERALARTEDPTQPKINK